MITVHLQLWTESPQTVNELDQHVGSRCPSAIMHKRFGLELNVVKASSNAWVECAHSWIHFPADPLVLCPVSLRLFTAAAATGSAPLSRRTRPPGSAAPPPLRPAAARHPPCDGRRLRPAGPRRSGQPGSPACKGWEEPPRPGAQRWGAHPATHRQKHVF